MGTGLLLDDDLLVGKYVQDNYGHTWPPLKFDRALGLMNKEGQLIGGVIFQNWNRSNVDVSYYGKNTLTPGILRCIGKYIISVFDPTRVTVITSKRNRRLMRGLQNLGFKLEGMQRCFYGRHDCPRNTAVRFVMFRERVNEIARLELPAKAG